MATKKPAPAPVDDDLDNLLDDASDKAEGELTPLEAAKLEAKNKAAEAKAQIDEIKAKAKADAKKLKDEAKAAAKELKDAAKETKTKRENKGQEVSFTNQAGETITGKGVLYYVVRAGGKLHYKEASKVHILTAEEIAALPVEEKA